ncbi:hypothetical protein CDL15_Pgr017209 [Punica granatum]|uniref:Uncharacterized protein n=1 Tax=Punica granatum TaxID=22663 RepID=A0A218WW16_PUNGR|nr:hypothetical protein CDL15_Pgr017209 [Punica granatum]
MIEEDRALQLAGILETSAAIAIEEDVASLRDDLSWKARLLSIKTLVTEEALSATKLIIQWVFIFNPILTTMLPSKNWTPHLDPCFWPSP